MQTLALYLYLGPDGEVKTSGPCWEAPDQTGDGEADGHAFLVASVVNGFDIADVTADFPVGPGLPANVNSDNLRVYRAEAPGDVQFFGIAIVPA